MMHEILRPTEYDGLVAAAQTRGAAMAKLSEPLMPNNQSKSTDSLSSCGYSVKGEENDGIIIPEPMTSDEILATALLSTLVTFGMAASMCAMFVVPTTAVFFMGGIYIVNSPSVVHKHLQITKNAGLRESVNNILKEIDLLKTEILFVEQSVNDLMSEANMLVGLEQDLSDIVKRQRIYIREQASTVARLIDLVNENEDILSSMRANLRQTFVAEMTKSVIRSDTDGDMKINTDKLPLLSLRLQMQLKPHGITLDTNKFEAMIKEDNNISNVLKFCGEILFKGDEFDNHEDDSSVDSELTFDFKAFCNTLEEEEEEIMSYEKKMSMIIVDEKYSKGSVEVARGKRITLMRRGEGVKDLRRKTILNEVRKRQRRLALIRESLRQPQRKSGSKRESGFSFSSQFVVINGTSAKS